MLKAGSIIVGLGILAASAHVNIAFTGGYGTPHAILTIAVSSGLGIGALALGTAWREGRRALALLLCGTLIAGEAFALLSTAERLVKHREDAQSPLRSVEEKRTKAHERVVSAEADLATASSSPRLVRAEEAKAASDTAVITKAAERGCATHCRALLEQQVAAAEREMASARAEGEAMQGKATAALVAARANLSTLEPATTATPLADRLGVHGWLLDLIAAALGSVAANGLAACLIAFGGHTGAPKIITIEKPTLRASGRVDAFAADVLFHREGGRLTLGTVYLAYRHWCDRTGHEPLAPGEFTDCFAELIMKLGAPVRLSDGIAEVFDVTLEPLTVAGPVCRLGAPVLPQSHV